MPRCFPAALGLLPLLLASPVDGASAGFRAHKNFVHQRGMATSAYTLVTFSATAFDTNESFDAARSAWRPPAGVVHLSAQVYWMYNAAEGDHAKFVVKIIKDGGTDVCSGIGRPTGDERGVAAAAVSCDDLASGTDFYQVEAWGTSRHGKDDLVLDGHPAHTYFSGSN